MFIDYTTDGKLIADLTCISHPFLFLMRLERKGWWQINTPSAA
jgi:hypothetical protein